MTLSIFRSGSDYRSGLGEIVGGTRSQGLPLPTSLHSLSSTTLYDINDTASSTVSHEESSDGRDGTRVPLLLRTESIRLKDLDRTLLAEVKDVLIPHERVVIHSDQVIGKGMGLDWEVGRGWRRSLDTDMGSRQLV